MYPFYIMKTSFQPHYCLAHIMTLNVCIFSIKGLQVWALSLSFSGATSISRLSTALALVFSHISPLSDFTFTASGTYSV